MSAPMTTWFTADLHFGHANIIRYCSRPFADVDDMNRQLIERWNENVATDDTVWVLGDVAMGVISESLPLVGQLAGHKRLLAGNHDRCWGGHGPRGEAWIDRYLDAGFSTIHQDEITLTVGAKSALACHFPYHGDSQEEPRYLHHRPTDLGDWLLHGHVHDTWKQNGRMINVGTDVWNFRPVNESELALRMNLIEIDGSRFDTIGGFYDEISQQLIGGADWGRNLDAFNDVLRGGFGTPENGFVLRWIASDRSRRQLDQFDTILEIITDHDHVTLELW